MATARQADVSFLANLPEDQRAQVLRMLADAREDAFAAGQAAAQQPAAPLARQFIREKDEPAFMELVGDLTRRAQAHGRGRLWQHIEQTLNPAEILHDVVDSFRREQGDSAPRLSASTTWMVQVNGDVQRGKSAVEAFIALVTNLIHDSDLCEDRACTILGTQMQAWARALQGNMVRSLWVAEGAVEAEEGNEIDEEWLNGIRCELLTPATEDACREAIQQGGLVVMFRTINQIQRVAKLLRSEMHLMRSLGTPETWPVMVLDESDRMLGSCNSAAIERENGRTAYQYERAINDLLGWEQHLRAPAWQQGWPEQLAPPLVCHISGTNALCFFWMLLRIGLLNEAGNLLFRMLDVVSFRRPRDAGEFFGFSRFARFGGQLLAQLHPAEEYVNEQVVEMYIAACSQPHHCLLDCTATRVSMSVDHNMQTHFEATLRKIMARPGGADASMPTGLVAVFVHGGNRTFDGNLGLRFTTGRRLRGEPSPHLERLQVYMRLCASNEPDEELAEQLRQAADDIFDYPMYVREARRSCDGGGYHSVEAFLPLLQHLEGRAYRETGREPEIPPNLRLSTAQLNLLLFMLRHVFPELPVVVIGHGMVRRCLSIVAVDLLQVELVPLLAVTHMLVHSGGNGADLAQQFLRPSTTLTAFHQRHGIRQIEMLASELVWDIVRAMVAFTEWQQFDTDRAPQPARQQLLLTIEERISSAEANDMSLASPLVQALQLNEEQARQMLNAFEEFEAGDLDPHALLVAIVISQELQLPHDPQSNASLFRPLFSLIRQPLAGAGAGRMERDLGEAMCILSDILNHRIPHHFRQAFVSHRRATQQRTGPDRLGLLIINELSRLTISGTRDAPAHEYPHQRHPLTEGEIRATLSREHPELRAQRGFASLFRAGGLGYQLIGLSVNAQTPYLVRRHRLAAHSTGRGGGRRPYEYWLIEGVQLPSAPPSPNARRPTTAAVDPHDHFVVEPAPHVGDQCVVCRRDVEGAADEGSADGEAAAQWFRLHEPNPAGSAPHVICGGCAPMMVARNWRACPVCQENIQRPRRLEAPTPQPQPQSPVVQSVVRGWPVRRDEARVMAVLPPLHQVAHVHFSFFYCPLIFAALGVLEPAEQAQWADLIDGPLVNGHPDFVGGQNTTFDVLLCQVRFVLHLLFPLFFQPHRQPLPLQTNGMLAFADANALFEAMNSPLGGRPYIQDWRQEMVLEPRASVQLDAYSNGLLEQAEEQYLNTVSPSVFGPFLIAAGCALGVGTSPAAVRTGA